MGSEFKPEHWTDLVHDLASVVHPVFLETGRMSMIPANVARALRLPVWSRFVSAMDSSLFKGNFLRFRSHFKDNFNIMELCSGRQLISKALEVSGGVKGDGLLGSLLGSGLSEEDTISVAVDLIIAAVDTVVYNT